MNQRNLMCLFLSLLGFISQAQNPEPAMEYLMDLNVELASAINIGNTPEGFRNNVPIVGGTFAGPRLRGTIMSGGADYQLHANGVSHVNAIYSIRTDDGVDIFVHNPGIMSQDPTQPYFFTTPILETAMDSKYAWLNQSIYVCRPVGFESNVIKLRFWRVCDKSQKTLEIKDFQKPESKIFGKAKQNGKVEEFRYKSKALNGDDIVKRAQVYLPYNYNKKDKDKKYNVVYLMHGGGDNTTSFFADPRSPLPLTNVLDHLIQDGAMEPVIVVGATYYDDDQNIGANTMNEAIERTRVFNKELHDILIPAIESSYNTYYEPGAEDAIERTRDHRAFGGFSMGALCTWYQMAYGNDYVRNFIPLSGDLWIYDANGDRLSADCAAIWLGDMLSKSKHADDFMVYGYTGTDDIAGNPEKMLFEALNAHSDKFIINQPNGNAIFSMKQDGKHYYGDINEYLYEILPMIWK